MGGPLFTDLLCISFYRHTSRNYLVQYGYSGFTKPSLSHRSPIVLQKVGLSYSKQYFSAFCSWKHMIFGRGSPIPAQTLNGFSVRLFVALCKKFTLYYDIEYWSNLRRSCLSNNLQIDGITFIQPIGSASSLSAQVFLSMKLSFSITF